MAKTITTTVTVSTVGDGMNHTDSYQFVNAAGPQAIFLPTATGNVSIASGVGAAYASMAGALAVPSTTGAAVPKTLKGIVADTGIGLAAGLPCLVMTPGGGGGFVLAYGAAAEPLQLILV